MHKFPYVISISAFGLLSSVTAVAQEASVGVSAGVTPPTATAEVAAPTPATEMAQADEAMPADPMVDTAMPEPAMPESEPMPEAGTAPVAETPAEAAEEGGGIPGWFRVDSDGLGLQVWFGASHDIGGVNLATDIYVTSGTFGEFDIGIEIPLSEQVLLIPMVGVGFDWSGTNATSLIAPQLFAYLDFSPLYIEYWGQVFLNSPFARAAEPTPPDSFYNRLFILGHVSETVALGVQTEPSIALNSTAKVDGKALMSLPVGARANIGYGENNTLGLFIGYETVEAARARDGIVGRFTFVKTW